MDKNHGAHLISDNDRADGIPSSDYSAATETVWTDNSVGDDKVCNRPDVSPFDDTEYSEENIGE